MEEDKELVCKICIPSTYAQSYDYAFTTEKPEPGQRVLVSFRQQEKVGVVLSYAQRTQAYAKLKSVLKVLDERPILSTIFLNWCQWLSNYYHAPMSEILNLALPKYLKNSAIDLKWPEELYLELHPEYLKNIEFLSKRHRKLYDLLALLQQVKAASCQSLKQQGFSQKHIDLACDFGIAQVQTQALAADPFPKAQHILLNPAQARAVTSIDEAAFAVHLLYGVTGSGKTEVYIEVIKKILARGQQVLMLVPEIGLTTSLHARLQARLGLEVLMLHSALSDKKRYEQWLKAFHAKASVVLGTRSAMFAPLPNLGLIIIDEEHDLSFKQLEGIRYSAKDACIMRAKMQDIPIVLGTATPSLESYWQAVQAKYHRIDLTEKALTKQKLGLKVVDLRTQNLLHGLAPSTLRLIEQHLSQAEQVLVFINRRGYAPLLFCHDCAWSLGCSYCDANMTFHQNKQILLCHYCGKTSKMPQTCPKCHSSNLMPIGYGTEQLYTALAAHFPQYHGLRFDRDVIKNKADLEQALALIQDSKVQWIVGTQMLAKGHHFANLGLVVVVDADSAFYQTDFRALERLGQLLTQVSGRAGRTDLLGEVCIQTHLPNHPLLLCLLQEGYEAFVQHLLKQRQEADLPPFAYLALIRVQGKHPARLQAFLMRLKPVLTHANLQLLGPAPAPMEKKAGIYRYQLIVKAHARSHLHQQLAILSTWMPANIEKGMRWFVELDPYDWSS